MAKKEENNTEISYRVIDNTGEYIKGVVTLTNVQGLKSIEIQKQQDEEESIVDETFEKEKFKADEASRFITVNAEDIDLPLRASHRKEGDRMTLRGKLKQSKKIKDIFINQKIPLEKRNHAWIIRDISNKIIWLVTYKESAYSVEPNKEKEQYIIAFHIKRRE